MNAFFVINRLADFIAPYVNFYSVGLTIIVIAILIAFHQANSDRNYTRR